MSKTLIGVQGSVMGWNDPFSPQLCDTFMRTGMTRVVKAQDGTPSVEEFIHYLRGNKFDFYMHHVMPVREEIEKFIKTAQQTGISYILGNEYNANGPYQENCTRYDIPEDIVTEAKKNNKFFGLIYDECEHLQLHPGTYMYCHKKDYDKPYKYSQSLCLCQKV